MMIEMIKSNFKVFVKVKLEEMLLSYLEFKPDA